MSGAETPPAVLTREYLQKAPNRVVFQPESLDEAQFIMQQLQGLGFRLYKPEFAQQLQLALKGSLYLDNDKTIMVSESRITGIASTADDFEFDAALSRKVDIDLARGRYAVFPRSAMEARLVLAALKNAGAILEEADGGRRVFAPAARAVRQGLLVKDGKITFSPSSGDLMGVKILPASDFGAPPAAGSLPPEHVALHAAFNEMAARMEQMSQRLERLEDAVLPKTIEKKPSLPKPANQARNSEVPRLTRGGQSSAS